MNILLNVLGGQNYNLKGSEYSKCCHFMVDYGFKVVQVFRLSMLDHQQQQKVIDGVENESARLRAVEVCRDQMPGVHIQLERENRFLGILLSYSGYKGLTL